MAQVTYPGVYVQEVPSGVRPIAAVSTSVAGFIGVAEKGPVGEAIKVFNFTEYQNRFGAFLPSAYLSHAVYQFFNNGGTQCYVVRVAGAGSQTANIVLKDRGTTAQNSLTITASSPGAWGNALAVLITDGLTDPGNEFNLSVFDQDQPAAPLETFTNLSMVPGASNFVETATSSSRNIRVSVNAANTNAQAGTSRGAAAPASLQNSGRTKFRVNVNGDGFQEVDLQTAVGSNAGQVADLASAANLAGAVTFAVRRLTKLRGSTNANALANFTCAVDTNVLLLTSGAPGLTSGVNVVPASTSSQDASGLLKLGPQQGGKETFGAAVTRPRINPAGTPPATYYLLGDNAAPTNDVASVRAGLDGAPITTDQPYIDGLQAFNSKEDVSLLAVPGIGSTAVVGAGMNYCANRPLADCFFIGDMSQDDDTIEEAKAFRDALTPKNSYGAVYIPWVRALDPTGESVEPLRIPPS